jgi:environmental stress-induced protein Ves
MKDKKVISILLILLSLTGVNAQNALNLIERSGAQTPISLDNIRKLTFTDGNMIVFKTDGNSSNYKLGDLQYLSFIDQVSIVSKKVSSEISYFTVYPNPVVDQLQIRFVSTSSETVQLKILNMQGVVFHQQTIMSQNGTNHIMIPVPDLSSGLYICYLQYGNKTESIRFLKH